MGGLLGEGAAGLAWELLGGQWWLAKCKLNLKVLQFEEWRLLGLLLK